MRYWPRVRRDVWERYGGLLDAVPTLSFNDRDDLQRRVLRAAGVGMPRLEHEVPSAEGFAAAVRAGLGWAMLPEGLHDGDDLIAVPGIEPLGVPLYWQSWRLRTEALVRLSDEVTSAAHRLG